MEKLKEFIIGLNLLICLFAPSTYFIIEGITSDGFIQYVYVGLGILSMVVSIMTFTKIEDVIKDNK